MFLGERLLNVWQSMQGNRGLSSGESEYYAMANGGARLAGVLEAYSEMGVVLKGVHASDSSAAVGTASRLGCGKLRHVESRYVPLAAGEYPPPRARSPQDPRRQEPDAARFAILMIGTAWRYQRWWRTS